MNGGGLGADHDITITTDRLSSCLNVVLMRNADRGMVQSDAAQLIDLCHLFVALGFRTARFPHAMRLLPRLATRQTGNEKLQAT